MIKFEYYCSFCCGIAVFLILVTFLDQVTSQQFIRDCNDPEILNHVPTFAHTYCFHTCGFPRDAPDLSTCTAGGYCICRPCTDDPGNADPGNGPILPDVCPPQASDPPDTDPNAEANCRTTCEAECAGGVGMICGEVAPINVPGVGLAYAKICTCDCPLARCTLAPAPAIPVTVGTIENGTISTLTFTVLPVLFKKPFKLKKILLMKKILLHLLKILAICCIQIICICIFYINTSDPEPSGYGYDAPAGYYN